MIVKLDVELEALTDRAVLESLPGREAEKERKEKLEFLDACLIKIGKDCRRIVEMRDKEEKSYVEIGKDLKIPIGTVMSRLSRCKEALKTLALQILKEEKNG